MAPSDPDNQQISNRLSRLIELKNQTKEGLFDKRRKKKKLETKNKTNDAILNKLDKFKAKPIKPIPKFVQKPNESDKQFKHRMEIMSTQYIKEVAFENKYNVDIKRNKSGEVEGVVKRKKDELELLVKQLKKQKKTNKKNKKNQTSESVEQPRLTKSQKWSLKQLEKKNKKLNNSDDVHDSRFRKETIAFGDVVHGPPSLTVPKKVMQKPEGAARPGRKDLLLKSIIASNKDQSATTTITKRNSTKIADNSSAINKKGKRKDLPNALRRQLDKQQQEIIEAYRNLKSKK
ncbi:hypothetical protein ABEB36_011248 [Hypothenemus hampei]